MIFETGQIAYLKSGGPMMTVLSGKTENADGILCGWFINNSFTQITLPVECLTTIPPAKPFKASEREAIHTEFTDDGRS